MLSGNAVGIMLFSTLNKHLAQYLSVLSRLKLGASLQGIGVLALLVLGYLNIESVVLVMAALFVVVASIGFVGPNAMALAMAEQARVREPPVRSWAVCNLPAVCWVGFC